MRDNEGRASFQQFRQRGLNHLFGLCVHGGCGFIEDQDAWVSQQGARPGLLQSLVRHVVKHCAHFVLPVILKFFEGRE